MTVVTKEEKIKMAEDYIDSLPMYQWLSLAQVDKEIFVEVFTLLDLNQFEKYRIGWFETEDNIFMKTRRSDKQQLLGKLREIETNLIRIDWVYISTSESGYIISLRKDGTIINSDNKRVNELFEPGKNILEYFEWIYKYGKNIKIHYHD